MSFAPRPRANFKCAPTVDVGRFSPGKLPSLVFFRSFLLDGRPLAHSPSANRPVGRSDGPERPRGRRRWSGEKCRRRGQKVEKKKSEREKRSSSSFFCEEEETNEFFSLPFQKRARDNVAAHIFRKKHRVNHHPKLVIFLNSLSISL